MTLTAPDWGDARAQAYRAGAETRPEPMDVPLTDADGTTLAAGLVGVPLAALAEASS